MHCACMRVCEFINNVLVVSGDVKPSLSVTPVCVVCCSLPIHQTDLYGAYRSVFSFNSHCLYMYIQDCLQTVRLQPEPPLYVHYVRTCCCGQVGVLLKWPLAVMEGLFAGQLASQWCH